MPIYTPEELQAEIDQYRLATPPRDWLIASIKDPLTGELIAQVEAALPNQNANEGRLQGMRQQVLNELVQNLRNNPDWN